MSCYMRIGKRKARWCLYKNLCETRVDYVYLNKCTLRLLPMLLSSSLPRHPASCGQARIAITPRHRFVPVRTASVPWYLFSAAA
jgi:hypothetical protein